VPDLQGKETIKIVGKTRDHELNQEPINPKLNSEEEFGHYLAGLVDSASIKLLLLYLLFPFSF
jgi:hypothetical protein